MSDVLALFKQTGALLHGHFILRSGLHSREFFQCALLLQDAPVAARVCGELAEKLRPFHTEANGKKPTVVSSLSASRMTSSRRAIIGRNCERMSPRLCRPISLTRPSLLPSVSTWFATK